MHIYIQKYVWLYAYTYIDIYIYTHTHTHTHTHKYIYIYKNMIVYAYVYRNQVRRVGGGCVSGRVCVPDICPAAYTHALIRILHALHALVYALVYVTCVSAYALPHTHMRYRFYTACASLYTACVNACDMRQCVCPMFRMGLMFRLGGEIGTAACRMH